MEKKYIITGASGLVARYIIEKLSQVDANQIIAVSSRIENITQMYSHFANVQCAENQCVTDFVRGGVIIHCAFTRTNNGQPVAESVYYAERIFQLAKECEAAAVINISTRSVYIEPKEGELNKEDSELNYNGYISMGKIVVEKMLENMFHDSRTKYSSLRLASVNELKTDNTMVRPLNVFVNNVIHGLPIKVVGGMQVMSFIDPRDVADAVCALLNIEEWKPVYNVGTGWLCTESLLNMAQRVVRIGINNGYSEVPILVEDKQINQRAGLDISLISKDTGWIPQVTLDDMIESLYKMLE